MDGNSISLNRSAVSVTREPSRSSSESIIEFYEYAGRDYEHWSRDVNMQLGFYRRGMNPFNREAMLEQMNVEIAKRLELDPTGKLVLLDLGCGVGAIARTVAKYYLNSVITGMTLVPSQVSMASELNAKAKLDQLTAAGSVNVNPFRSPDGKLIAYNSDATGRPEVWVMNADGSEERQASGTGVMGHFMRWSKAGDAVIYRRPGPDARTVKVKLDGTEAGPLAEVAGGSRMSLSPDGNLVMDVIGHKSLWVSPMQGNRPNKIFEFEDPDVRIDYPVWSPDGNWVLFDRFRPQGGDIWMMENFE